MQWTNEMLLLSAQGVIIAFLLALLWASRSKNVERQSRLQEVRDELSDTEAVLQQLQMELIEEGKKAREYFTADKNAREALARTRQDLLDQRNIVAQLNERLQSLNTDYVSLKTTLEKREEHFREQFETLQQNKEALTKEFENLANRILDEKGKAFSSHSQSSLEGLLKPFREQITAFQSRINEVHDQSLQRNSSLNAEIQKVLEIGLSMSKEASNLTSALKGDSQQRGAWGEAQLRRTLEMSGLVEDAHFEVQTSFRDIDGKQKQTDYLVKLPDDKHIIIDSKVSLNAYDRAVSAETPEEQNLLMAEHVKAVKRHIDDLSSKDYTNLIGMHSPSFVLMFMPIEPAYIDALKFQKDLFEYGYRKNIVLVSHTTLIPILRTVSNLWMIDRSNKEAREISDRAGEIYNQVSLLAERLKKLGGSLNAVSSHYNGTVTALVGQQGLYGKVQRFGQLSTKVSKSLPELEPARIDFEEARIGLLVEEINENSDSTAD